MMSFLQIQFQKIASLQSYSHAQQTPNECALNTLQSKVNNVKRMSLSFSLLKKASLSIEAAFVVPLFLFGIITILSSVEVLRMQSNVTMALHQSGKELAIYGYAYDKLETGEAGKELLAGITTSINVTHEVKKELGKDAIAKAIENNGVTCIKSEIMKNDMIDLVVAYQMTPIFSMVPIRSFTMANRCRMRAWTGYDNTKAIDNKNTEEMVYITETGSVYHRNRNCSHLTLSIRTCSIDDVFDMRNEDGSKYYPCEECGYCAEGTVYITDSGNRYHSSITCSGLKRTIRAIPISQVGARTPCLRCGK